MIRKIRLCIGIFCLASAIVPAFYGVRNVGNAALVIVGSALVFWPKYAHRITSRKKVRKCAVFLISAGLVYCAAVSSAMIRAAYFNKPPDKGEIAVIVLGGKINGNQPSPMLRRRLDTSLEYLRKNPESICVVTGGQGQDEDYPEAFVMKKYLVSKGVGESRVIEEDKSTNTRENLRFAASLIPENVKAAVIITDGFHQLRAGIFANAEGVVDPYALSSSTPWGLIPAYWVRDMLGVAWAWVTT